MDEIDNQKVFTEDGRNIIGTGGCCPYCGASLNHAFYFCLSCATPYRTWDSVLIHHSYFEPTEAECIRAKAPRVWTVFWTYAVIVFIVGIVDYLVFNHHGDKAFAYIAGIGAITIATIVFECLYWQSLKVQLCRIGFAQLEAYIGLALLVPLLGFNYFYHFAFLQGQGAQVPVEPTILDQGWNAWTLITLFCVIPAITEEVAFRGLIQHWLQTAIKPWRAVLLASALFAGLHVSVLSFPYLFLVGLLLGWIKWKTQSLYPSMLIHFLHNVAAIFVLPLIQ